jgi:putative phage-type endonuclease
MPRAKPTPVVDVEAQRLLDLVQGSPEWRQARCGSLGASGLTAALAKTKSGAQSAGRKNTIAQLVAERMTGRVARGFTSRAMEWGTETEDQARAMYAFVTNNTIRQVGLVRHPTIAGAHASPDGFVNDDGLVEIKCPNTATHIYTLLNGSIDNEYLTQMQWQMACTGRAWCDFVSFDPDMPDDKSIWIRRVRRDEAIVQRLESDVRLLLREVEATIQQLEAL